MQARYLLVLLMLLVIPTGQVYFVKLNFIFTILGSLYSSKMLFQIQTSVLTVYLLLVSKKPRYHQSSLYSLQLFDFKGNMAYLSAKMILYVPSQGLFNFIVLPKLNYSLYFFFLFPA